LIGSETAIKKGFSTSVCRKFIVAKILFRAKQIQKSQGVSNLRLASRAVRGEPVFPFSAALRAANSVGKKSESLILVRLFDEIRTFFERN